MNPHAFAGQFLEKRGLSRPDGRPLYAYRCKPDEFDELAGSLHRCSERSATAFEFGLFCLFAAEWWRREHWSGPWKWAGILESVGLDGVSFPRLYRIIEIGLGYWRRPLLHIGTGRGFLITLACEGGLPLQLVRCEGAKLRHYFEALLDEFHLSRERGEDPAVLADKVAGRLPPSLRHEVVYRLGGDLVNTIWELRSAIGNSKTPVRDLDVVQPRWRDELPLEVDDDVARVLLNPLVEKAAVLTRRRAARIR